MMDGLNNGILAGFVQAIADMAGMAEKDNPPALELAGRHFVRKSHGGYEEVAQLREDLTPRTIQPTVIGVDSLMAWVKTVEADQPDRGGVIQLSRRGQSKAQAPLQACPWEYRDQAFMAWYDSYMPPSLNTGPLELRAWLDELGPDRVTDHSDVIAEINTLAAAGSNTKTVRQTAAVIQLRGENKDEVLGTLRRRLITKIPIGDPGFETGIEWLLSAKSVRGELVIQLGAILEPSLDDWAAWARLRVEEIGVPDGWVVLTVA